MEEVNKANEVKITSVEKAKDPKSVEAGKKLGAMSKQAKEKKAASQKIDIEEDFQIPSINSVNPLAVVGVVGVVGVVVYYKYFSKGVVVNESKVPSPEQAKQAEQAEPTPKRKELDSLD